MGEAERGESAPRVWVSFWCANRHETRPSFATDASVPDSWECPRCGYPAGQDEQNPPAPPRVEPYKTHLAYVKERRSDTDGAPGHQSFARRLTAPGEGGSCSACPAVSTWPSEPGHTANLALPQT
jgi:hypothetical protein